MIRTLGVTVTSVIKNHSDTKFDLHCICSLAAMVFRNFYKNSMIKFMALERTSQGKKIRLLKEKGTDFPVK